MTSRQRKLDPLWAELIRRRRQQGVTVAEVADALCLSRAAISMIENGHRYQNNLDTMRRYGRLVGVEISLTPHGATR